MIVLKGSTLTKFFDYGTRSLFSSTDYLCVPNVGVSQTLMQDVVLEGLFLYSLYLNYYSSVLYGVSMAV